MSEHTKEPWVVEEMVIGHVMSNDGYAIADCCLDYSSIKASEQNANARRIVACINACVGVDTDKLENMTASGYGMQKRIELMDEIERQRDYLLSAFKDADDEL